MTWLRQQYLLKTNVVITSRKRGDERLQFYYSRAILTIDYFFQLPNVLRSASERIFGRLHAQRGDFRAKRSGVDVFFEIEFDL